MNEYYKTINYKGTDITVSNLGKVYWNGNQREWYYNTDGYATVSIKITSNGNSNSDWRSVAVHILVALAFIPNPNNLPEVNHIDYNRKNPSANNLEWITHKDNVRYSICNKPDITGKNNPNYGNKKLSERYKKDKQLSIEKQSRKGIQNGRSRHIDLFYDNMLIKSFDYIVLCCQYLIDTEISDATNIESVRGRINACIRNNKKYKEHYTFIKR